MARIAGPGSQKRNVSRLARTRSDSGTRPQVRHPDQAELMMGHHDVGGCRADILHALDGQPRPGRAQPYRRPTTAPSGR